MSSVKSNSGGCNCCHDSCSTGHEHGHSHGEEVSFAKIACFAIGSVTYIAALILQIEGVLGFAVFFAAYAILGWDVVFRAVKNIFRGDFFDENFLMSISTIGAFYIGEYPEGVAVMLFYQIGEILQEKAAGKSRKSIRELMNLKADFANVTADGEIVKKDPRNVDIGSLIVVKPGERFPLDGVVAEGTAEVDSSPLTGESVPLSVMPGTAVLSGYINISGVVTIKTTSDYNNSTAAKIMELVENAASRKAPTERFITKFSRIYTPVVVFAAVLLAVAMPVATGADFSEWMRRALVFLVVSCPCALVVSVPLSFFSGIGEAGKKGVLLKGGNVLQTLAEINTVVFDKTGTLTKGVFEVREILPEEGVSKEELLKKAYMAEKFSNHPISKALSAAYVPVYGDFTEKPENFEENGGFGITAVFNGNTILAGNARLMKSHKINLGGNTASSSNSNSNSSSVVHVAENNIYLGCVLFSDSIREGAKEAIDGLKKLGVSGIVMLTGDNEKSAGIVAKNLDITDYRAGLLPAGKVSELEQLHMQSKNVKIMFVGDGINDAPVLARSDVGAAMGGIGSDAAVEAADLVLMNDELGKIPTAVSVARNTMKIVRQNIAFTLLVKFAVLMLATVGIANMWMAVFADVGVALLVVLNSVRRK